MKSAVAAAPDGLLVLYKVLVNEDPAGETMTSPKPLDQIASPETVLLKTVTLVTAHE